ncbi:TIGR01777 family oxidoreductase [Corynebacterium marinum]|uniref:Nucleoside-diphosphate sugar epimerase n=1 Tax=Corynebacterium marinum DSM 44953 TaxID=1224162 RepID=A0A0B6TVU7_9CORY|nr:TIGR01777 family oxidoreductase [Corynebacterium marinum]AJK68831.1 nucleoside-diphosphate sugar epimerase [Corynebacterium marinum DSM 44953]GGO21224.1 epimerase [Corynebacterium marinum]
MAPTRIIISGASGLIGSALATSLEADGVEVVRLVRRQPRNAGEAFWEPGSGDLDPGLLAGADAVVNLNGASIGKLPWTGKYRQVLRSSRLAPTRTLADAIRTLGKDAPMLVSASAVGIYGDRPGETLTETSGPGEGFLARLCVDWEAEALKAGPEAKVALLRTASLLHPEAVLKPLIPLTRFGLNGPLGTSRQIWPWISLEDEVRAIRHIIDHGITGPVNLSGPTPASARDIGRHLAERLRRPYLIPAPKWALRMVLGRDAAESLLLADARVEPEVLTGSGFQFTEPTAQSAIDSALGH